jgi:hypothetical protein
MGCLFYDRRTNKFVYCFSAETVNTPMYFRQGTPAADGTLAWDAVEQTAIAAVAGRHYYRSGIAVDTYGKAYIIYNYYDGTNRFCYVTKNNNTDGTWTTASGYPLGLKTDVNWDARNSIVPLTGGKMYGTSVVSSAIPYGFLYDGSSWSGQEQISATVVGASQGPNVSLISVGDDVFFLSPETGTSLYKRTYGTGWGGAETVLASARGCCLTSDPGAGTLYIVYQATPTATSLYFRKRLRDGLMYAPVEWVTGEATLYSTNLMVDSPFVEDGMIGASWIANSASPWDVRFGFIRAETPLVAHRAAGVYIGGGK